MTDYRNEAAALYARAKTALDANVHRDEPAAVAVVGILAALLAIDDDDAEEPQPPEKLEASTEHDDDDDTIELDAAEIAFREQRWQGGRAFGSASS